MLVQFATSTEVGNSGLGDRGRRPGPVFRVLGSRQRRKLRKVSKLLNDRGKLRVNRRVGRRLRRID